jgi:hypothetical protein
MLSILRRLARPCSAVLLVMFAMPAWTPDCFDPATGETMPCCLDGQRSGSTLDGACCNVKSEPPSPNRAPSAAPLRETPTKTILSTPIAAASLHLTAAHAPALTPIMEAGPPLDRLYLRLSIIRR